MLYTSQNKLFLNIVQYSIIKGFRESTVFAQSFQMACLGFAVYLEVFKILLSLILASK